MQYAVAMAVYNADEEMWCKVVGLMTSAKKAKEIQMQKLYDLLENYLLSGMYDEDEFASLNDFVAYQEDHMWGWEDKSEFSAIWFDDNFEKAVISITII